MTFLLEKLEIYFRQFSHNKRLYIVPTFNGMKLFGLCFILLFTGLIYANNFIMFFNFLLFSLFICSMFYTHFNLNQVKVLKTSVDSSFAGQKSLVHFIIKNESSLPKYMLKIKFPKNENFFMEELTIPVILPHQTLDFCQSFLLKKRGHYQLGKLELWTSFPFSFFKAFTFFEFSTHFYIYPQPKKYNFHLEQLPSFNKEEEDSSLELTPFQMGHSYRHIHWKKYATTQSLVLKTMAQENKQDFLIPGDDLVAGHNLDDQLSFLSYIVADLMGNGLTFGLKFRDTYFSPNSDSYQHKKILETLSIIGLD
jgi:uncharacterized protein (DUF58 family)